MGVPLAHIPDQVGDGHASYARHHAQVFIDLFADLGVKPDRYYWMSDIYPTGAMDPFIRTALDEAHVVRDLYRRVSNVQHPDTWHPVLVICGTCGRVGTTIVTKWDGERVFYECRAEPRDLGASAAARRAGCRRSAAAAKLPWNLEWAAQWSLFGVTIEPCGKDLATAGGSRDRIRRDRARGVRARAADQRAVRVPEHRREEDVDLEGSRDRRAPDRRGAPAGAAADTDDPHPPEHGDRLRPRGHRRRPAPVRRVRPARRRRRRARSQGRAAGRLRVDLQATRCAIRAPTSRPRRPRSGPASPISRS